MNDIGSDNMVLYSLVLDFTLYGIPYFSLHSLRYLYNDKSK